MEEGDSVPHTAPHPISMFLIIIINKMERNIFSDQKRGSGKRERGGRKEGNREAFFVCVEVEIKEIEEEYLLNR